MIDQTPEEIHAARTRHEANPARDLTALARALPALVGSASPIVRLPGGTPEGSPAERVQELLTPAKRALRRLAWLSQHDPASCNTLLAWWVLHGEDARLGVPELLSAMRARAVPIAGPRAARDDARADGIALVTAAEQAYCAAGELVEDSRWLLPALESVARSLAVVRALLRESKSKGGRKATRSVTAAVVPPTCAEVAEVVATEPTIATREYTTPERERLAFLCGRVECAACGLTIPEGERHECFVAKRARELKRRERAATRALRRFGAVLAAVSKEAGR